MQFMILLLSIFFLLFIFLVFYSLCYLSFSMLPLSCPAIAEIARHSQGTRPRGYKTFSMLNSDEHEISIAHEYKNINKIVIFTGSD